MSDFGDKEISRVLVLIAMEAEARPLLDSLQLQKVDVKIPFAPFVVYNGDYNGKSLTVVTNGKCGRFNVDNVGTTPGKQPCSTVPISLSTTSLEVTYDYPMQAYANCGGFLFHQ